MSAPLIWIGIPLIVSAGLFALRKRVGLVIILGVMVNLVLGAAALWMPANKPINLGLFIFQLDEALTFLGRRFVLGGGDRAFIGMVFLFGAFWFGGTKVGQANRYFIPLGMTVMGLLVAALAVEPFLYAALLIELAVLFSIPILNPPEEAVKAGVLRFLTFQTLAMPFVLLAGWAAGMVDFNPADEKLLLQGVVLLGLGFSFWLAVFPFYNWMPLLFSQTNPFAASFIILLLNTLVFLLALDFLNAYTWLREFDLLYTSLRLVGTIMIATGGIWALFQLDIRRILAYAIIMDNGFSLLALSLDTEVGLEIFVSLFPVRFFTAAIFSLSLAVISAKDTPTIPGIRGLLLRAPLVSTGLLTGLLGMAGLPLLAAFPLRFFLLENLSIISLNPVAWSSIGMLCLLLAGFRVLSALADSDETAWQFHETWIQRIFLGGGVLFVLTLGIFPRLLLPEVQRLLEIFIQVR